MKAGHWSGITGRGNAYEDFAVQESMGPIVDRTQEYLGTCDRVIYRARQLLLDAVKRHQATPASCRFADEAIDFARIRAVSFAYPQGRGLARFRRARTGGNRRGVIVSHESPDLGYSFPLIILGRREERRRVARAAAPRQSRRQRTDALDCFATLAMTDQRAGRRIAQGFDFAGSTFGRIGGDPFEHRDAFEQLADVLLQLLFSASSYGVLLPELRRGSAVGVLQRIAVLRANPGGGHDGDPDRAENQRHHRVGRK